MKRKIILVVGGTATGKSVAIQAARREAEASPGLRPRRCVQPGAGNGSRAAKRIDFGSDEDEVVFVEIPMDALEALGRLGFVMRGEGL